MKYFPLDKPEFEHQFGIRALGDHESIIEATRHYEMETTIKRRLLGNERDEYFCASDESHEACCEAAELVLEGAPFLSADKNQLLDEKIEMDPATPLLSIARHVQEDLVIMDARDGCPLIAGVVCFPSGWSVREKFGKSTLAIHAPVPEFEAAMGSSTMQLLERLKPGRPVWRMNWGIRPSDQLDQSPKHSSQLRVLADRIRPLTAATDCFFRVERQTLSRLPRTGHILFTIHTHQCPLGELTLDRKRIVRGVLKSCPVDTLRYKGILPMRDALLEYLKGEL